MNDAVLDKQYFKIEASNKKGNRTILMNNIVYLAVEDVLIKGIYKYYLILQLTAEDATNKLYYNNIRHVIL